MHGWLSLASVGIDDGRFEAGESVGPHSAANLGGLQLCHFHVRLVLHIDSRVDFVIILDDDLDKRVVSGAELLGRQAHGVNATALSNLLPTSLVDVPRNLVDL